ncbi:hypothetical protein 16Q_075c [Pseudomonas phage 16Q]|nr:hypothetical protein 16Q_075c [Pseudomonas phage 16Q]
MCCRDKPIPRLAILNAQPKTCLQVYLIRYLEFRLRVGSMGCYRLWSFPLRSAALFPHSTSVAPSSLPLLGRTLAAR